MQLTDELKVVVSAEVDRALRNLEQLNGNFEKTENKAKKTGEAIDKIAKKAALISAALGGTGIAAIKLAGNLEQTQLALEVLLGDATKATQIKNEWTQLASSTPFSSSDIDSAGKKLLAFNIEAEKVTDTLRRIGDISAATGSSISDIADIYGKAAVQGRLFAEDINQFQGRGIPVVQSLAKVLGVAETEVRDLVTQGKVGFPELEAAFKNMTDEGGQFSGMMDKLSQSTLGKFSTTMDNAKLALASFGEVMLDSANSVLDAGNNLFQWLQDMDDGTKRFIVSFGGVAAMAGPVVLSIKAINAAMAALAANPVILGVVGVTAGIGLIAAAVNKAQHQFEDFSTSIARANTRQKELLTEFAAGDTAKKLDAKTTDELIRLYPELAGKIKAYSTSVAEASEAVKKLNEQKIIDASTAELKKLDKLQEEYEGWGKNIEQTIKDIQDAAHSLETGEGVTPETETYKWALEDNLSMQYEELDKAKKKVDQKVAQINATLNQIGKGLSDKWEIIDLPVEPVIPSEPIVDALDTALDAATEDAIKTWQEWFEQITGVNKGLFTTGAQAGKLYAEGMAFGLQQNQDLADALGKEFDLSEALKNQMSQVESDISQLLSIPAQEIDDQFLLANDSIKKLIETYKELEIQAKKADVAETIADLQTQVDNLGKSEADLTLETLAANGATEEQLKKAKELLELLEYDESVLSWQEKLTASLEGALSELGIFSEETNKLIAELGTQMLSITFDSALSGFSEFGKALGEGKDAAESLGQALSAMSQQILQQLPTMFLQAGLQLIAQGQWALGLGFIAAAGSTALIGGYVEGKTGDTEKNAKGGVYGDGGYRAFAKGGAFTNSIVDRPTFFKFARGGGFGTGLMGEAGPEAIMPLKRGSDGTLGVSVSGQTGFAIQVVINNYSSEKITAEEKTYMDGQRKLEITVGAMINQHISGGKADKALGSRYGLKAQGV
ncbi:MAG: tape measure protein [Spirochaetia bacterium]|nr:tape measure protein [Spirochaetia bacterium]